MRGAARPDSPHKSEHIISTHAPHARRGGKNEKRLEDMGNFYSRASCEARRDYCRRPGQYRNFYSRASCEARQGGSRDGKARNKFLLTRLMRGAANTVRPLINDLTISTHAPHARRGRIFFQPIPVLADFYSRSLNFYSRASCEARLASI